MFRVLFLSAMGCLLLSLNVHADTLRVGCIASFSPVLEEIGRFFEKTYPHKLIVTTKTTSMLYKQIQTAGDLDIAFLGDLKSAQALEEENFAVKDARVIYAVGKLALWSTQPDLVDTHGEVLKSGNFQKLSIPNPKMSIYGRAAQQALTQMGLWEKLQPKIIFTNTMLETQQLVSTEQVDLGFMALSLLNPNKKIEGSLWIVPKKLSTTIVQPAVLLKPAENNPAATALLQYLKTQQARNIIEKYGYSVP